MAEIEKRILRVDLSRGETKVERIPPEWITSYLGGKGLGFRYLLNEVSAGTHPYSAENRLIFVNGILAGTIVPVAHKISVITKSPATGTITDCSMGGMLASELQYAGLSGLVIQGKAHRPVCLVIQDGQVELRSADLLWGRGCFATEESLHQELGRHFRVCSIGPGGENLIPFACISSELYRQAGRGGVGAVMGSKNLKAIAVRGTGEARAADVTALTQLANRYMVEDLMSDGLSAFRNVGTLDLVEFCHELGILPTRNFSSGVFEGYEKIGSVEALKYRKRKKACFGCPLACGNWLQIQGSTIEGPEYETLALAGSNCGVSSLEAIVRFNRECDDLGLDTISCGNIVALAMEMTEKGVKNFGMKFGDLEGLVRTPKLIAHKKGIGEELCLGARDLAAKYQVSALALETKGLEYPGYDPRGCWGMGLAYATSDRGACHLRSWTISSEFKSDAGPYSILGKGEMVAVDQNRRAARFSAGLCSNWALTFEKLSNLLNCYMGRKLFTDESLMTLGERVFNLGRIFNVLEGFRRKDDYLPYRIMNDQLKGGPSDGKLLPKQEFEQMLSDYYNFRGWDADGIPTKGRLESLKLEDSLVRLLFPKGERF